MLSAAEAELLVAQAAPAIIDRSTVPGELSYHERAALRVLLRAQVGERLLGLCAFTCDVRCADGTLERVWDSSAPLEGARAKVDEIVLRAASCMR